MKILLASNSPRRKELLAGLGYSFETVKIDCEENYPETLEASKVSAYLSELKAGACPNIPEDTVLITADTAVVFDGEILRKPQDEKHAFEMLKLLSGQKHSVYTSVTFKTNNQQFTETDAADVYFSEISDDEIKYYIDTYKPFDKAGSYGIQEWLGMAKISKISGSFYTVMGFPAHMVYGALQRISGTSAFYPEK